MTIEAPTQTAKTWTAQIYIAGDYAQALEACRDFCERGCCVTVTPTTYIYTHGEEAGVVVGLIQYPRRPAPEDELHNTARHLALHLLESLHQGSVTVVTPGTTRFYSRRPEDK